MKAKFAVIAVSCALALGLLAGFVMRGVTDRAPVRTVVLQKVTDLGELRLARHEFSQAATWESSRKAADWAVAIPGANEVVGALTRNRAVGEVTGHVDAGIDFSEARIEIEGKTVRVSLPAPTVQETVVDANPIHHNAGLFWRNNDMASVAEAEYQGILRSAAVRGGILERARTNARALVNGLFDTQDWNIDVRFSPGTV
ncbi:MAG: DUF4230 domain-containing protein [Fimbriimonadaceae bacterium]